jgi:hypothetical protein
MVASLSGIILMDLADPFIVNVAIYHASPKR